MLNNSSRPFENIHPDSYPIARHRHDSFSFILQHPVSYILAHSFMPLPATPPSFNLQMKRDSFRRNSSIRLSTCKRQNEQRESHCLARCSPAVLSARGSSHLQALARTICERRGATAARDRWLSRSMRQRDFMNMALTILAINPGSFACVESVCATAEGHFAVLCEGSLPRPTLR